MNLIYIKAGPRATTPQNKLVNRLRKRRATQIGDGDANQEITLPTASDIAEEKKVEAQVAEKKKIESEKLSKIRKYFVLL